jgi:hypothetical protein
MPLGHPVTPIGPCRDGALTAAQRVLTVNR